MYKAVLIENLAYVTSYAVSKATSRANLFLDDFSQGCSGAGTRGDGVPPLFRQGDASPTPALFGLKFVQKLVHCCNWLLTKTQCKIISVQQK